MWLLFGHHFDTCLPTPITTPTPIFIKHILHSYTYLLFFLLNDFPRFLFKPFLTIFFLFIFFTFSLSFQHVLHLSWALFWNVIFRVASSAHFWQTLFSVSFSLCRRITCTRRPSRLWFTPFLARHPITLKCGQPPRPPTAMSVRVCCGVSHGRACAAQSAESNAMKNARSFLTQTVCRVSH